MPIDSEMSGEGATAAAGNGDDSAAGFTRDPILVEHLGGECRSECSADVILALAPVEAERCKFPS